MNPSRKYYRSLWREKIDICFEEKPGFIIKKEIFRILDFYFLEVRPESSITATIKRYREKFK